MNRREFVALLGGAKAGLAESSAGPAIARGVSCLWGKQSWDGGWHSGSYGLLRSGQSLTGFVLNSILDAGESERRRAALAATFLERNVSDEGALGRDPVADDYPCYATALGLRALIRMGRGESRTVRRMVQWLRGQQLGEHNGWKPADAAFGAWGFGGAPRVAPHAGHVDLSMTRHVLQALAAAGVTPEDPAMQQARVFLARCQNHDGGFLFSTVVLDANKAGESGNGWLSYGTATADGILSMRAAMAPGVEKAGVQRAVDWMNRHSLGELPPGFESPARQRFAEGLRYYWAASATRALGGPACAALRQSLIASQRVDGSWANPEPLVKEDDPLIATGFSVSALGG